MILNKRPQRDLKDWLLASGLSIALFAVGMGGTLAIANSPPMKTKEIVDFIKTRNSEIAERAIYTLLAKDLLLADHSSRLTKFEAILEAESASVEQRRQARRELSKLQREIILYTYSIPGIRDEAPGLGEYVQNDEVLLQAENETGFFCSSAGIITTMAVGLIFLTVWLLGVAAVFWFVIVGGFILFIDTEF